MRAQIIVSLLIGGLSFASVGHALLLERLDGKAYYDPESNITWLADTNFAKTSGYDSDGKMTWDEAQSWVSSLDVDGVTGWRLASLDEHSYMLDDRSPIIFYPEPFLNVSDEKPYWSSQESLDKVWVTFLNTGFQQKVKKTNVNHAWAVHDGDIRVSNSQVELIFDGNTLTGARNVSVNGELYNVKIGYPENVEHTPSWGHGKAFAEDCAALYNGCNQNTDFTFQTEADATAAAQALLEVMRSAAAQGNIYGPSGCPGLISDDCYVLTPYAVEVMIPLDQDDDPSVSWISLDTVDAAYWGAGSWGSGVVPSFFITTDEYWGGYTETEKYSSWAKWTPVSAQPTDDEKLIVSPPEGTYFSTQDFDFILYINEDVNQIKSASIKQNGVEIIDWLNTECFIPGTVADGGSSFRCKMSLDQGIEDYQLDVHLKFYDDTELNQSVKWKVKRVYE